MGLDDAYIKAVESMAHIHPLEAALASGAGYRDGRFVISLFDRTYTIYVPSCETKQIGSESPVPKIIEVLLMHYLTQADGAAVSGDWISYRQLPGAKLTDQRFANLVAKPMINLFGNDVNRFREAAEAIGGWSIDHKGDAAYSFKALPRLPVACIFYIGEEDIPPSISILFDGSASHYLPTEDLSVMGGVMVSFMKRAVKADCRKKQI